MSRSSQSQKEEDRITGVDLKRYRISSGRTIGACAESFGVPWETWRSWERRKVLLPHWRSRADLLSAIDRAPIYKRASQVKTPWSHVEAVLREHKMTMGHLAAAMGVSKQAVGAWKKNQGTAHPMQKIQQAVRAWQASRS
jgi:DNA-binding transcriptional regulator YiaG